MIASRLVYSLRRLWSLERFAPGLRVFIALAGVMLWSWQAGEIDSMIPLFLGVIASALAETDDSWQGRLRALIVTLGCFAVASLSVELTFGHPLLFATGLALSTFTMIMLGALGQRYATITTATLILSVYTMINIEHRDGGAQNLWQGPLLLLAGAGWYGTLSVLWCAVFTHQPVRQSLSALFDELGAYLAIKASLFEPLRGYDRERRRIELARQNGRVVEALNRTKEMIFARLEGNQSAGRRAERYLRLYFIAQDIHERASSTHYDYDALAEHFFHSDVLFRCQRVLKQQGRSCRALGRALLLRQAFDHSESEQALSDLRASIEHLKAQPPQVDEGLNHRLLRSLTALAINLAELERQLASADNPDPRLDEADRKLFDRSPHGWREGWQRVRGHLRRSSPILRHALRMSMALVAGYGLLLLIHPTQGYWILLTTLFVCRPSFGATHRYFRQRIIGTVVGLVAGWALITLFPWPPLQAAIAVLAGVIFFINRASRYVVATAAITLMVLACFNQVGDGFGLIWPRLFDTLMGAVLAALAVFVILPDWRGRRLNREAGAVVAAARDYLGEIRDQYRSGKRDDLAYRLARRNAHNADAALSNRLTSVMQEPAQYRHDADEGFRLLVVTHALLGHLSTLGAHRRSGSEVFDSDELEEAFDTLSGYLDGIAGALAERRMPPVLSPPPEPLAEALERLPEDADDARRLVHTQLALLCRRIRALNEAATRLLGHEPRDEDRPERQPATAQPAVDEGDRTDSPADESSPPSAAAATGRHALPPRQ
ncbi:YccS family putative transporter [Kushneria aurantia]|uniref:YccS family putative transporter n=1 Tax=Kushneria aurantia TaxID=504092 RepID=A0ABV6G534_9GAMM|nr:YccS family putative transporter [Kushneria aurantia]